MATNEKSLKEIRKAFPDLVLMDATPQEIKNPFTGEGIVLQPLEIALYDFIMGCNRMGKYDGVRKGCDWFRRYNAEAYMVLLD